MDSKNTNSLVENAIPVGRIAKDLAGLSRERMTRSGTYVIDRESQEVGLFRPFPFGKEIILLEATFIGRTGSSSEEIRQNFLLLRDDWGVKEVQDEIEGFFPPKENN